MEQIAIFEVYLKKANKRFSLQLSPEQVLNLGAQLGDDFKYEDDTVYIWLVGSVVWESEEQRQAYLKKNKFTLFNQNPDATTTHKI